MQYCSTLTLRRITLFASLLCLVACATGPNADPRDPLEPMNRGISTVNHAIDKAVLSPVARGYRTVTPSPVRTAVGNFFGNIQEVWSIPNSLLQGKVKHAIESTMRVSFNTVFGFGGLLDIATELRMQRHDEDFGQTLGVWGVPTGPYIVWPLLGPSTVRDSIGRVAAMSAGVQTKVIEANVAAERVNQIDNALTATSLLHTRAELLPVTDLAEKVALDLYSFTKDAYLQSRENAVRDGQMSASAATTATQTPPSGVSNAANPSLAPSDSPAIGQTTTQALNDDETASKEEEDWTRGLEPEPATEPPAVFIPDPIP